MRRQEYSTTIDQPYYEKVYDTLKELKKEESINNCYDRGRTGRATISNKMNKIFEKKEWASTTG